MMTSIIWIAVANALLELILYPFWLHPIELDGERIPIALWSIAYIPLGVACVHAGLRSKRALDAILIGLGAGIVAQLTKAILAALSYPGHEESLAAASPGEFYTVHFARMTIGFIVLLLLVYDVKRRLVQHREAPQG